MEHKIMTMQPIKIIEIPVYTYDQLTDRAKQAARDWYSEGDCCEELDHVVDMAKSVGLSLGVDIKNVYYSLSYAQGDGAIFEGSYSYCEGSASAIRRGLPDPQVRSIADRLEAVQRRGSNAITADIDLWGRYSNSANARVTVYSEDHTGVSDDIDETVTGLMREFMDWIYAALMSELEYRNSEKCVSETIINNEYTFTETGARFG